MRIRASHPSPIGPLLLVGETAGPGREVRLSAIHMEGARFGPGETDGLREAPEAFAAIGRQLDEYFAGRRRSFDLDLDPAGTPFQLAVWEALRSIPYGTTTTYGEIAARIGRPGAGRAVGGAVGRNPLSIVVPCHRVVGSDGSLTGFGGGLGRKTALLELEGEIGRAHV